MRGAAAAVSLVLLAATPAAAKPPRILDWAFELLADPAPPPEGASAIVLLDEKEVEVFGSGGKMETRRRLLLRILSAEGRDAAYHPILYGQYSRLAHFRAWTIREDGSAEELDRSRVVDVSLTDDLMYDDARTAVLPLRNVGVGSAIAVTYILDEDRQFLQDRWPFQWRIPVRLSRYRLKLPPSWSHQAAVQNHAGVEPVAEGGYLTWELRDLPGIEDEVSANPDSEAAAALMVTYLPRGERSAAAGFRSWGEVARWYHGLVEPQAKADDDVRRTASELVAPHENPLDRAAAIGRFAQDLRYVSISLGISAYQPHATPEVFRNRYADCKDKATLMLAMLSEVGTEAYPVLVHTRTDGAVVPSFPSPLQFNHVIVGLPVDEPMSGAPTVEHPTLGRLLLFDPTDDLTPFGDLPWTDQGTQALVVHPEVDGLVELPNLPPGANRADRQWEVAFDRLGGAEVRMRATYTGQYARMIRGRFRGMDEASRRNALSASLGSRIPGTDLREATFGGLEEHLGEVRLEASFRAERFGRAAGPLLVLEPLRLLETLMPQFPEKDRSRAVLFPFLFTESDRLSMRLPDGFVVSEPMRGFEEESEAGAVSVSLGQGDGGWTLERHLELRAREIPPSGYAAARDFLAAAASGAAPLVLERESS